MESPFSIFEDGYSLVKSNLEGVSESDNEKEESERRAVHRDCMLLWKGGVSPNKWRERHERSEMERI